MTFQLFEVMISECLKFFLLISKEQNLKQLKPMAANMAGLRAGLQQMRAQMRARGQALHQTLRAHSTKAAAAGGGGGLLAFAQS